MSPPGCSPEVGFELRFVCIGNLTIQPASSPPLPKALATDRAILGDSRGGTHSRWQMCGRRSGASRSDGHVRLDSASSVRRTGRDARRGKLTLRFQRMTRERKQSDRTGSVCSAEFRRCHSAKGRGRMRATPNPPLNRGKRAWVAPSGARSPSRAAAATSRALSSAWTEPRACRAVPRSPPPRAAAPPGPAAPGTSQE